MQQQERAPQQPKPTACAICGGPVNPVPIADLLVPGAIVLHEQCSKRNHERATARIRRRPG